MTRFAILTATALASLGLNAQTWGLQQCIDYAVAHSNQVRAAILAVEQGQNAITEARDAFLPTVNATASQGFNFGRGLNAENMYVNNSTSNFAWGASLNLPLFNGLHDVRNLRAQRASLQKLLYDREATKDDVTLNVISQYLQVLFAKEVEQSAASQAGYSAYEVTRQQAMVNLGKVPEADLLTAQAQAAQDSLQLVTAGNDVKTALVTLANLLQLTAVEGFDIVPITEADPALPGPDQVYADAMGINNSILAARQDINVAAQNVSVARTGYIPRLSFTTSASSSYYSIKGIPHENFGDQMRHNYSTYLGFNLSIPIFDGFGTRNSVRRAKVQQLQAELALETRSSDLYKTIQLAYYQAEGARSKYLTSQTTIAKTRASFEAMRQKYSLGRATPTEFEQAKNNLFRTEVSGIQAHYEYLLRARILQFYRTNRP